ncbi:MULTISPECIES: T9SS type B sorting domain-containing protein [Flavobacterium]|uniref:T9SS type B sorting domain-containing protein n=1 Tax=Flavobacterium TaxID=237 RepID=UPI001FCAE277|nr:MULTISPECIES: T9SS type B sorting domain-containing protein [Flavobacterium]UOK41174.1 T9SS type B sorting domain-containing protein [Flavobacterium enshiense]
MHTSYIPYQIPLLLLFVLFSISSNAQYITIDNTKTPTQLVKDLFSTESCVEPTNVSITGWNFGNGQKSYAWFNANSSGFPLGHGLIISTGKASSAVGPNTTLLSQGPTNWPGDSDLERAIGENNTVNATIVEFDFVSVTNYVSFNYIFSSEQYLSNPKSNQCNSSDGFALLIKKNSSPNYKNLGVVPKTTIPVKVTTVRGSGTTCPPANAEYFDAFNGRIYPTNFNGQTQIMNAEADIEPGISYHVKLVIADQANNLYDSAIFIGGNTFSNDYAMGEDRLFANGNPLCPGETLTITPDYIVPGTRSYTWHKNGTPIPGYINISSPTYTIASAGVYMLLADVGTCKVRGYMNVEYVPTPNDAVLVQCDDNNDGISAFNLNTATQTITGGLNVISITGYYHSLTDAQNQQNKITNPQSYSNSQGNTIVVRVENKFGCPVDYATITLQTVNNAVNPLAPVIICDSTEPQDGLHPFDLDAISQQIIANNSLPANYIIKYFISSQDALLENNQLNTPFTNTIANQQTIYARIINGPDCYGIIPVTLKVNSFPNLLDETIVLCNGESIVLDAGSGYTSYSWDTTPVQNAQSITVSESEDYTVTVTNADNCVTSKTFTVIASEVATIISIEVNSFSGMNNSVTVHVSGNGNYEFSLDGVVYQDSNVFTNVLPGEYQVFVRDKNGCGTTRPQHIIVLDYPRFFTPNGDGYNDIWAIKNLDSEYPNSKLFIFDRYGKLVKHIFPLNDGWNGTLNNSALPSDDYWFNLTLDNGRNIKGHFTLKR